jgi:hypothetical protein
MTIITTIKDVIGFAVLITGSTSLINFILSILGLDLSEQKHIKGIIKLLRLAALDSSEYFVEYVNDEETKKEHKK